MNSVGSEIRPPKTSGGISIDFILPTNSNGTLTCEHYGVDGWNLTTDVSLWNECFEYGDD